MMHKAWISVVLAVAVWSTLCYGQSYSDSKNYYEVVYGHYYNEGTSITDIIPMIDQSIPINVSLSMVLDSLTGFDAVLGQIDISGSLKLDWIDETSFTGFTDSAATRVTLIDYDKAWAPSLVLLNAIDTVESIGDTTYQLKYTITSTSNAVSWQPKVLLRASCTPDVTYYPFDRQTCEFTYSAWGYSSEEIRLISPSSTWDTTNVEKNGIWKVISTSSTITQTGGSDSALFVIVIEREPLYFTFNIALPIILLGLLNGFAFLLPAESGERIGFCVTCFLSFVVLLQTTMGFLPRIANPMSLLCYYVFIMMCFSAFINIMTILMLRVYHKPAKEKVPRWMQTFVQVVSCKCKCIRGGVEPTEVEWPEVGRFLDFLFFLAFIAAQSAFSLIFLLPVGTKY